jgi:hypothetical protein
MTEKNQMHMHNFLFRNKRLIKPHLKKYIKDKDRAFFDIRKMDDELLDQLKEEWSEIPTHFRCWIISEALLDSDKRLKWWSGKTHRIMYRPTAQPPEMATT